MTLSPQETRIAHLLASGLSPKKIAVQLDLCSGTVAVYKANICKKLGFTGSMAERTRQIKTAVGLKQIPPPSDAPAPPKGEAKLSPLTPREREVLEYWSQGDTITQISLTTCTRPATVANQLSSGKMKVGMGGRSREVLKKFLANLTLREASPLNDPAFN